MPEKNRSKKGPDKTPPQNAPSSSPPLDPRMPAAISGQMYAEDTIDIFEYWQIIWKRRRIIVAFSFAVALLSAGYSLTMTNIYRAEALVAPTIKQDQKTGQLSALGGMGGLASIAGISLPSGGNTAENLAILKSRKFLWEFIKDNNLMPILFEDAWDAEHKRWKANDPKKQPSLWAAYRILTGILKVKQNKKTRLVTVAVEWKDPQVAARWANELIQRLNDYLRDQAINHSQANLAYLHKEVDQTRISELRQTLFDLIASEEKKAMLANTQEEFGFRVLDPATPPDKKAKPNRKIIVILSTFLAGLLAVFATLIYGAIERRKQES